MRGWWHYNTTEGYVEAKITIPDLPCYNKDVLFLVVSNHKYGDRVPVQIGPWVIDQLVVTMTEKQLQEAEKTWKQLHLGTTVSKRNTIGSPNAPEYALKEKR